MSRNNLSIFNSEETDIRRFFRKLIIFCIPLLVAAGFIAIADPFNFLNISPLISNEVKAEIAPELNSCFWKMNVYLRQPTENILLGDSRVNAFKPEDIEAVNGEKYFNFAYGGASLQEDIDTFWFASKKVKLRKVYIGVNLNNYNDYENVRRTQTFTSIEENPTLYFVNRTVWRAALYSAYSQITNEDLKLGVPTEDREAFWQTELEIMRSYYQKYAAPKKYKKELKRVAEYCIKNNIELNFIIFPTHIEEQSLIKEAKLETGNRQMRIDLQELGTVYDFNIKSDLTKDKLKFSDPVHLNSIEVRNLTDEIWGGDLTNGEKLPNTSK